jgi:hypothetical protein
VVVALAVFGEHSLLVEAVIGGLLAAIIGLEIGGRRLARRERENAEFR